MSRLSGAGYRGITAARQYLARVGASVVVLERDRVGAGVEPSRENGGQALTGLKLDPETLVRRYGAASRTPALFDIRLRWNQSPASKHPRV